MANRVGSREQKKKFKKLQTKVKKEHKNEVEIGEQLNRGQKPKRR